MGSALEKDAMTETFEDLSGMLVALVRRFRNRYQLNGPEFDFDEMIGEANLQFIHAYNLHNDSKGPIRKWVYYRVWINMYEKFRRFCKNRTRTPLESLESSVENPNPLDILPTQDSEQTGLVDLIDELSNDAEAIVRLVLETPGFVWRDEEIDTVSPRRLIHNYMRQLGWKTNRIQASFNEIASVLK